MQDIKSHYHISYFPTKICVALEQILIGNKTNQLNSNNPCRPDGSEGGEASALDVSLCGKHNQVLILRKITDRQ